MKIWATSANGSLKVQPVCGRTNTSVSNRRLSGWTQKSKTFRIKATQRRIEILEWNLMEMSQFTRHKLDSPTPHDIKQRGKTYWQRQMARAADFYTNNLASTSKIKLDFCWIGEVRRVPSYAPKNWSHPTFERLCIGHTNCRSRTWLLDSSLGHCRVVLMTTHLERIQAVGPLASEMTEAEWTWWQETPQVPRSIDAAQTFTQLLL